MTMTLHGVPSSTCTSRAMLCFYEKQVEFELVQVDLSHGGHKNPLFLDKNPFGLTPVLEDGDLTLFGSRAITAYIDEKYSDRVIDLTRKNNLQEAATVKVWTEVESQQFQPVIAPIIFHHFITPMRGKTAGKSVVKESLQRLEKVLCVYELRLSKSEYLAGDFYSLADLHHLPCLFYFMQTPFSPLLDRFPHVKNWWAAVSSRPAFRRVSAGMNFGYFSSDSTMRILDVVRAEAINPNLTADALDGGPEANDNFADERYNYEETEPANYNNAPFPFLTKFFRR